MAIGVTTPAAEPSASPGTERFLRALELMFRAGRYYPAEHVKTDELTAEFHAAAADLSGEAELVFEVRDGVLVLQGEPVPASAPGVQGFSAMLEPLAVARMTIAADIPRDQLHALVTLLPLLQQQVLDADADERFAFTGLPDGVTIDQREFVVGEEDGLGEFWEDLRERILAALKELENRGLEMERAVLCRHLLRGFGARVAASLAQGDLTPQELGDSLVANLDMTRSASYDGVEGVTRSLDGLMDLLEQSMVGDDARRTEQTFRRLIGILERSVPDSWHVGKIEVTHSADAETGDFSQDLSLLLAALTPADDLVWSVPEIRTEDRREFLSIVAGMLATASRPGVRRRLRAELEAWLGDDPTPEETKLFHLAVGALLQGAWTEGHRAGFSDLLHAVRETPGRSSFELLQDLARLCPAANRTAFWPLVANEVLLGGPDSDPVTTAALQAWLLPVPEGAAGRKALETLAGLEAAARERFDRELVRAVPRPLADVFGAYLRLDRDDALSQQLVAGLHARPASWLGACVLPLLDRAAVDHREIYALLLRQAHEERDLPRLRDLATELLLSRLANLPAERRREGWVRGSILMLGRLSGLEVGRLLERIRNEKRLLVLPTWPAECREAATTASEQIRRRGREVTA
ncbi:MAG TPA: hypothetical protein PLH84_15890 [Candidatus Krumholzibacteria bacterium]|nr:hypothetical protein [Candidatus Krumholzibacteria bacterium]